MSILLSLELEEVNQILTVLGETPTKYGFYPLLQKIKGQGEAQANITHPTEQKQE